jgi:hypothetical protein
MDKNTQKGLIGLQGRGQAFHALDDAGTFDRDHLGQQSLGSLRCAAAQVAFSTFGAHQNSSASQAEPL